MDRTKRIAVVGGGISGVSILNRLVNNTPGRRYEIDIYDSRESMGHGQPFREDSEHLLINVPFDGMSLSDDDEDFKKWMTEKGYTPVQHPPRTLFGEYVEDFLNDLLKHENVQPVYAYVTNVLIEKDGYLVRTETGERYYDAVFLAVGQMDYNDPYQLKGKKQYIHNPYPVKEKLHQLKGKIGIVGTGLTAIDCIRHLIHGEGASELYVFSRSGELPSVRGTEYQIQLKYFTAENIKKELHRGLVPLQHMIDLFKKELSEHQINTSLFGRQTGDAHQDLSFDLEHADEVGKLQYLIIEANPVMTEGFHYLSRSDKKVFMEKYHQLIDENHSPMPDSSAEEIISWIEDSTLKMFNDIEDVDYDGGFTVSAGGQKVETDVLINATGPLWKVEEDDSPLLKNMLENYIVESADFGGIIVDQTRRVISPRYGTMNRFYALGALSVNVDYLSASVNILNDYSKMLVEDFYKREED